jgi:hypothetical protein
MDSRVVAYQNKIPKERHGETTIQAHNMKARISPHVLGDDLVCVAARQVKVDEVGEQSHGYKPTTTAMSSSRPASPLLSRLVFS